MLIPVFMYCLEEVEGRSINRFLPYEVYLGWLSLVLLA